VGKYGEAVFRKEDAVSFGPVLVALEMLFCNARILLTSAEASLPLQAPLIPPAYLNFAGGTQSQRKADCYLYQNLNIRQFGAQSFAYSALKVYAFWLDSVR
jgi:hypothetical protein